MHSIFFLSFLSFLCLACARASRIPGLPPVQSDGLIQVSTSLDPQSLAPASSPPPSFLRRLFDRLPSISSSRASASDLTRWINDRPRLIQGLKEYEDQVVIRFNISDAKDAAALRTVVDRMLLDVWDFTESRVDIRIPSRRIRFLTRALPSSLLDNHSILVPDLARVAAATYPSSRPSLGQNPHQHFHQGTTPASQDPIKYDIADVYFHDYQPYSVIVAWMRLVDSMFRGRGLIQMISIGKSYEGRDIPALRVGIRPDHVTSGHRREIILVTGGFHAREWISTSSVNYVAWSFIQSMDEDPVVKKILERFDFVFVPLLNPDGYDYTWEVDRLWRKSRQRTKMSYCPGLDLDHSFSYQWDSEGRQHEPCSGSYGGEEPLQAVEASQLVNWARNETENGFKFAGYLDLHSYSQQVLVPYSFSCQVQPPNIENLQEVAMNLAKHLRLSNGESYTVASACGGSGSESIGPFVEARGGSAIDYFYHELKTRYSYQIKLRDTGSYGFLLPSDNIVPAGEEIFQAMKYLGDFLLGNNGHEWLQESDGDEQEPPTKDDELPITELRKRQPENMSGDEHT